MTFFICLSFILFFLFVTGICLWVVLGLFAFLGIFFPCCRRIASKVKDYMDDIERNTYQG